MKIAIVGARNIDTMEWNLQEAFSFAGHDCEIFDLYDLSWLFTNKHIAKYSMTVDRIARQYSDRYDRNIFHKLAVRVKSFNPDLVVCLYRFIHPCFVREIKQDGRKVIHVNPDQMTTLEYQQVFASDYDAWFTKDPFIERFMRDKMKLNVFHYDEAFNKRYHKKPDCSKKECEEEVNIDVMTYGTFYPYRTRMLKHLLDAGIDLKVFGTVPRRFYNGEIERANQHKYIKAEEKSKLLFGSKIVFNQMHFAEVEGVNCRFFEANGAGAFQLCDYKPVLKDLLPVDPELVTFRNIDEGIEKIQYYLKHPEERYLIADKIYNHFMSKYSYDNLVQYLLEMVQL